MGAIYFEDIFITVITLIEDVLWCSWITVVGKGMSNIRLDFKWWSGLVLVTSSDQHDLSVEWGLNFF